MKNKEEIQQLADKEFGKYEQLGLDNRCTHSGFVKGYTACAKYIERELVTDDRSPKTIEKKASEYAYSNSNGFNRESSEKSFIAGAKWMRAECAKDMERDQLTLDVAMVDKIKNILKPNNGNSTYTWAVIVEAIMEQSTEKGGESGN